MVLLLLLSRFSRVRLCATPSSDSPGKNTGVGCHFLLQCMKVKSESEAAQSCLPQRPRGLQPAGLLRPWDFPGKSTGEGGHCLLLGLQRLIKMHWLFCSFTGESRGFPRANPVPFEAGPVIHVVGLWFSSAVLFCVE